MDGEPSTRLVLPPISPWKVIAGGAAVLVLSAAAVIILWWAGTRGLTGRDLVTARLDALKVGLGIGVGSGGLFALYLAWRRQRATEAELGNRERALLHQLQVAADVNTDAIERRVTDLYSKAVEQLGADKAPVRLGGLYALERLAQDNPEHRQTVVNVLCAYLRMPYRLPGVPPGDDDDQRRHDEHRERVQEREVRLAAQRILAQHLAPQDSGRFWDGIDLDLTGANLIDFDLQACRVGPARFDGATFNGLARFSGASFTGHASFERAAFTDDVRFDGTSFTGDASFDGATGLGGEVPMSTQLGLADLLELGDPYEFDPADTWVQRSSWDRLRVKFGIRADGVPIEIDLKESSESGMGPHGLLVGVAGSGKSELLRTLVLGLAVTHPPDSLNFLLVDFEGDATFTRLNRLPHTSAVVTNVAGELHLVDQMVDAINDELVRRQELLRAAGGFSSLRDYEKARRVGAPLPEVPTLLVIFDEFLQLLSARPDFIDMFVQIGRTGRSLGVHLLLASQRIDEAKLRGLETHLSYRIALRTASEKESRTVLGVTDAFRLPRAPGHGLLRVGPEPMERFRSAYVSVVHQRNTDVGVAEPLLDILVDRLASQGTPARQMWPTPDGRLPR
jgi:DNA segregation ATPase FtsK/SpoIIIE-like protein